VPRKMSEEKEKEFEELSLFLEYYSTNRLGIDRADKIHPSNCLEEIVEKFGKSKALQGLKQAINDSIEDTSELDFEDVKKLDSELSSRGIVSLSVLRKRYWSKYKKVLKRGSIKNETEYYLINGLLCDLDNGLLKEEKETLSSMLVEFEENA
jgi:hypothetical protein